MHSSGQDLDSQGKDPSILASKSSGGGLPGIVSCQVLVGT